MTDEQRRAKMTAQLGRDPTYEEFNWHKLSPEFREAHNRKLVATGKQPIPPPIKDEYVRRPPSKIVPVSTAEFDAKMKAMAARESMMSRALGGGDEGFKIAQQHGLLNADQPEFGRGGVYDPEGFTIRR